MREMDLEHRTDRLSKIMESGRVSTVPLDIAESGEEDLLKWCKTI